jgi:hypothetical protein
VTQPAAVEVEHPDLASPAEHDVVGVEVGVLHAGVVEVAQAAADRGPARVVHQPRRQHLGQRARAGQALGDQLRLVGQQAAHVACGDRRRHRQLAPAQLREEPELAE